MKAKIAPLPWVAQKSVVGNYTGFDINGAKSGNQRWVASVHSSHTLVGDEPPELAAKKQAAIAEAEANAEFIVRACNSYQQMVDALRLIVVASDAGRLEGSDIEACHAALRTAGEL